MRSPRVTMTSITRDNILYDYYDLFPCRKVGIFKKYATKNVFLTFNFLDVSSFFI